MSEGDEAARRRSIANEFRKKLLHYKELDSRIRTGTLHGGISLSTYTILSFLSYQIIAIFFHLQLAVSVVMPSSNCYALDNSSRLVDFTDWIGHVFEYEGKDADLVVRFCKDVESRSQVGYVDFGRYATFHHFVAGLGPVDFVQGFYNGDLINCEYTFDKMGRTAKVNIICGNCSNRACKGELGCICSVTYDKTMCRVLVELAIPCVKHGSRVFKGFTVGFHPRSWEVVYNGMTQLGFEKPHHEFSFGTEQTHVSLYLTAISALSGLVRKPVVKVYPDKGLEARLSGSAASGSAPTTLSPTILNIDWRCMGEIARGTPYEINISIPVEDYDPIEFTLTKLCVDSFLNFSSPEKRILWNVPEVIQSAIADYKQGREGEATRGWAMFGVLCCIFIVLLSIFCCGGFIYKTRIEHQHGLDALPGMTILSACLEAVSGPQGYRLGEDVNANFINQASWERASGSAQGTQKTVERRYGSI